VTDISRSPSAAAFYGHADEQIAQVICCSLQTARAFKHGTRKPGKTAFKLWSLYISGRMLGDAWQGWRAADGELFDPEGNRTTQSQLRAYAHVWALARELARGDQHLTAELDRISNMALARIERRRRVDRSSERSSPVVDTPEGATAPTPGTSVHPLPDQPEFSSASDVPNGSAQPRLGGSEQLNGR
jgi:hypothetical protein